MFARTEMQEMLGDLVARLLEAENAFEARHARLSGDIPDRLALWPTLADQGILGAAFDEAVGGFGGTMRDVAVVMAEVGRRLVVEPVLAAAVCGRVLAHCKMLDEIAAIVSGERVFALAHMESGDPFATLATNADADDAGYRLTGYKLAVRHADVAHAWLVTATLSGAPAVFLVEADAANVAIETFRLIDGSSAASLSFSGAPATLLGDTLLVDRALATALTGLAAEAAAIIRAANDATFSYLRTRSQFGVPLASFQALQHRAADMFMGAEEARALVDHAIDAIDAGASDAALLASAAKAGTDRVGFKAGHDAVQLHGGMAYPTNST